MRIILLVFLFLVTTCANAQKGETTLYFKNGDTIYGFGNLKGAEFIKFKSKKETSYEQISFKNLYRADVILKDTVISYRLYPIVKKNAEIKEPSVIGQYVSGKVNLYVKGEIKIVGYAGGTMDARVHYFLRKENELNAVHIGSNSNSNKKLLKNTENLFSKCPELLEKILTESNSDTSIFEVIAKYNLGCSE